MSCEIGPSEALSRRVIGCAIRVHQELGPGMLESVYETCLLIELRHAGLDAEGGRRLPLRYRGIAIDRVFIPDVVVEGSLVLEVKAVEHLLPVHRAQLITYLKLSGCPVGLLMNFHTHVLTAGIRRVLRPDLYRSE